MSALSLSFSLVQPQRWVGVFDPSLALTLYGAALAQGLGAVTDLWMAREFWHMLDNVHCYQQRPELLLPGDRTLARSNCLATRQMHIIQALQQWQLIRMQTDPSRLNVFWIGDRLGESLLPRHTAAQPLISHWEFLAGSLEDRIDRSAPVLTAAVRDTVALAVALPAAILTYQLPDGFAANQPPEICLTLENWRIPCRQIDRYDHLAAIEREELLHLINAAGVAKLLWSGLHLAILHLVFPCASALWLAAEMTPAPEVDRELPDRLDLDDRSLDGIWEGTQGFWYWL